MSTTIRLLKALLSAVGAEATGLTFARDTLTFHLPMLGPGSYRVRWKVLGSDSHVTKGVAAFSVREAPQ